MLSSHPGAIYQQDNARPHTARLSQQYLQGYDVLPWPTRSPDLSPIEHVWDALGRQLQPSRDTGELTAQMQRLWQDLPQGVISDLIESMPRRISACIAARAMLAKNFKKYFLDEDSMVASYEWIRDLFQDTPEELSTSEEEIFIDFTSSEKLKGNFVINRSLNLG
ncbi:uncharacterized protein TNCV_318781 [Trichonephila clavipes]|nr:uncharacterized protein TNCV_318781 [Trichonephila clavipes]